MVTSRTQGQSQVRLLGWTLGVAILLVGVTLASAEPPTRRQLRADTATAGSRPECVDSAVRARGTGSARDRVADPDHASTAEVASAERLLLRVEARQQASRTVTRPEPGRNLARVIDVHVHVIRDARNGGVTRRQIRRQITVLNHAYAGHQSPFAARTPFRFRLARVRVTFNASWYRMDEGSITEMRAKRRLHRGGADDLNLYIANSRSGLLGWATQPTEQRPNPRLDGVVISHRTLPGGNGGAYSAGDVSVHEVGHWLGLFHTFSGRCGRQGDLVADTPAEARASYTCPVARDSCKSRGRDPVRNFMDYSYDRCMTRFTAGQSARMVRAWTAFRDRA